MQGKYTLAFEATQQNALEIQNEKHFYESSKNPSHNR